MAGNSARPAQDGWLAAHGRLWYGDRWYRIAWIVWPQAIGLLIFTWFWLAPNMPATNNIQWGKPASAPQQPAPVKETPVQKPAPVDMSPCTNGDFNAVIQNCSRLIASGSLKDEDIATAYWNRGRAYHNNAARQGASYQEALSDYDRAISLSPRRAEFHVDRGRAFTDSKNYERALQDMDQAVQLRPDWAATHANRGRVLRLLKRPNEALASLATAIERDPKLFAAYENRAYINEERADWRAVYDDSNKLIELSPNSPLGYELRGHAFFETKQYATAIDDFTKAISVDARSAYGYSLRGRSYYLLNDFDRARADYEAALRIDPNYGIATTYMNELRNRTRR